MSVYNTITSLGESPLNEDIIYVGTDDGIIQVTEDGGESWRKIEVGALPGVPDTAFVNDIRADLHDEDTVYVALDNHKYGDYAPYLLKSEDRGETWRSLADDIPEKHLVWRIVQDHEDEDLLFLATEFGVFASVDGGEDWAEMSGGLPTIPLRDITIQRREDDLVVASFGRGFYILDDISPIRDLDEESLEQEAMLWTGRDALWYIEETPLGNGGKAYQGDGFFVADNPPFGAVFTYYLKDALRTKKEMRQEAEKEANEAFEDTPMPSFEELNAELSEEKPQILLVVRDEDGDVVRRIEGPTGEGLHRVSWDLTRPSQRAVRSMPDEDDDDSGFMVAPGTYSVALMKRQGGETTELVGAKEFEVKKLRDGALPAADPEAVASFWDRMNKLSARVSATRAVLSDTEEKVDLLRVALERSTAPTEMMDEWSALKRRVESLDMALNGDPARESLGERQVATVSDRLRFARSGVGNSTYGPTPTHRESAEWAEEELSEIVAELETLREEDLPAMEEKLAEYGAPWTPGAAIPSE
jgi:hypothetical protein